MPDLTFHDLHPDASEFRLCEWHKAIRHLAKHQRKLLALDESPCSEEGTEKIWTIIEDYWLCPKHKKEWEKIGE